MTPMKLERALEVSIEWLGVGVQMQKLRRDEDGEADEAAAVLREFMEKGLPFYRAAEVCMEKPVYENGRVFYWTAPMKVAYDAMKESK